jgi:hypothetical protein
VLPNFVIVGAMKCGTSSLAKWLGDHPDAWVVPEKELHFFNQGWDRGLAWYESRFTASNGQARVGEASPTYLVDLDCHDRMASVLPDARLVAMVRDPVDRAYSHYWHWRERMGETRTFEQVVDDELAGKPGADRLVWNPERPEEYSYLGPGVYLKQLEHLASRFERGQLKVIVFDDLSEKPAEVFRDVCRFLDLGVDQVPESVGRVENSFRYYYPRWLWAFFVRVRIGRFIPARAAGALHRAMVRTGDPYPPMDPAVRARLGSWYADDNRALGEWLGRDLSQWSGGAGS